MLTRARLLHLTLVYLLPLGLINGGNAAAYLFQIVLARSLTPADLGAFNALLALTHVVVAPATILPMILARALLTAEPDSQRAVIGLTAIGGGVVSVVVVLAGWPFTGVMRELLQLDDQRYVQITLLLIATTVLYLLGVGWLQGRQRYIAASAALGGVPALRFVLALWLVGSIGAGLAGALWSAAIPGLLIFGACLSVLRDVGARWRPPPRAFWRDLGLFAAPAALSALLLLAFWNMDVIIARALTTPEQSGLYAIAAVLARIPFLLAVALANVLFPETVRIAREDAAALPRVLGLNLTLAGALSLTTASALAFFAEPILVVVAGQRYAGGADTLRVLSFAMAALALLQLVVTFSMARNQHAVLLPLAAALGLFLGLAAVFGSDPVRLAYCLSAAIAAGLLACLAWVLLRLKAPVHAGEPRP